MTMLQKLHLLKVIVNINLGWKGVTKAHIKKKEQLPVFANDYVEKLQYHELTFLLGGLKDDFLVQGP